MGAPIEICFDYLSPYAYVAWHALKPLAARHGRVVVPVPVLFAGLLGHHGTRGPAEVPAKAVYVIKDAFRKAHRLGLPPLSPPPGHPFNPLTALRVSSLDLPPGDREHLIDALFAAVWAGGGGLDAPEAVARAASSAGLDGPLLLQRAADPEIKARLRAATDAAIARGAFGVPTLFVDGEMFWGVDSLPSVDDRLAGRDPFSAEVVASWGPVTASAQRRGV